MKKLQFFIFGFAVLFVTYITYKIVKAFVAISLISGFFSVPPDTSKRVKTEEKPVETLCSNVIGVCNPQTKYNGNYIFDKQIYEFRCDTLSQVKFWRQVMTLHEDSLVVSLGHNRKVINKFHHKEWKVKNDSIRQAYRDSVRCQHNLDTNAHVLVTGSKKFFYDFDKAFNNFDKGINCFVNNGVDPWYAQAILLIESPNKLQKSNAGAYGPFQLMKEVARLFGLKVNRHIDERADFDRSAFAASSLIKYICIPNTKKMLDSLHITYNETDLWFRLMVMHSYHAGAGNVQKALFSFKPEKGGMDVIYTLWHTETRHFKTASQNYSQLVLAAMLEMNDRIKLTTQEQKLSATETAKRN